MKRQLWVPTLLNFALLACQAEHQARQALASWERINHNRSTAGKKLPDRIATDRGVLRITPNPVVVCDGSGLGIAAVRWESLEPGYYEIRIGREDAPDNQTTLYGSTSKEGEGRTGKWARDGLRFFVREVNTREIVAAETIRVSDRGCQ